MLGVNSSFCLTLTVVFPVWYWFHACGINQTLCSFTLLFSCRRLFQCNQHRLMSLRIKARGCSQMMCACVCVVCLGAQGTRQDRKPLVPPAEVDRGTPLRWNQCLHFQPRVADDCESGPRSKDNHSNLTVIVMKLFICTTYANQENQSLLQISLRGWTHSVFRLRYSRLTTECLISRFTQNHFICPSPIYQHTRTHTYGNGGSLKEKGTWCTYFPWFMTIVINVRCH